MTGSFARNAWAPDYPWGTTLADHEQRLELVERYWGTGHVLAAFVTESELDATQLERMAHVERNSASPGSIVDLLRMVYEIDVRPLLPSIGVPTLITHYTEDPIVPVEHSRYMYPRLTLDEGGAGK